ncbi:hypothetical protein [uncultured Oscillibacter sp.]|uniref:hypothetical protein n=1 Tax=uncultured Oscillibacter sp. TaxID=876091 RepID=UPI0025DF20E8|nr:hypothetical protein [uncultured Oscillibacter sp.]
MQNRYAGDVGDFGKLGLLRVLAKSDLKVGINWYLTEDEDHNNDGKHISYLTNPMYAACDPELRGKLGYMVYGNQRSVRAMEEMNLIPGCVYFNQVVPRNVKGRAAWHQQALLQLLRADMVFLDPDNGLKVKSVSPANPKSIKCVFCSEIEDYYAAGQSVIFYNQRSHEPDEKYLARFSSLLAREPFARSILSGLRFSRGSTRDYIFISRPEHTDAIRCGMENILRSSWAEHFGRLVF